jgi:dynein heavy chain
LSNEDLLEILGDSKNPFKVQRHLKKCFEGINEVVFKAGTVNMNNKDNESEANPNDEPPNEEIIAIVSREHERVELIKSIFPQEHKGNVEVWLLELENMMKQSVQNVISESVNDYNRSTTTNGGMRERWISNWQS